MENLNPEAVFDDKLAEAGAALELCSNMSAFANLQLYRARQFAEVAGISPDDPRVIGLRELIEVWESDIAPAFAQATQKDPTGPRGEKVTRPWRDPELTRA